MMHYKHMRNCFLKAVVILVAAMVMNGCGEYESSMDEETERALVEQYGEPVVVELAKPGALKGKLGYKEGQELPFLRVAGRMGAEDFAYLNTFEGRYGLKVIDLLDATIVAGDSAYLKNMDEDAYKITKDNVLGSYMFDGMSRIEKLYLPLNLTKIEKSALYGRYNLDYVFIPQGVKEIGDYAFKGCSQLSSLVLPDSLEIIGYQPFSEGIKSIRIPRTVQELSNSGIGEIEDIYMEWTPEEVEKFGDVSLEWIRFEHNGNQSTMHFIRPTLHVPAEYIDAYKQAFRGSCKVVADTDKE